MARTIESELHEILQEIAPEAHDLEEQAQIIAHASSIYERAKNLSGTRAAKKHTAAEIHEARMMDSLLQAMGRLADWTLEDEQPDVFDATGLEPDQIVHRASYMSPRRSHATKGFGADFDIINDDDLDLLLNPAKGKKNSDYEVDDLIHDAKLYDVPGLGKHRSDSLSR